MIKDYLKAGYPTLCMLTYEPYRAEQLLPCDGWRFFLKAKRSLRKSEIRWKQSTG